MPVSRKKRATKPARMRKRTAKKKVAPRRRASDGDANQLRFLIRASSKRTSADVAKTLRRILGTTARVEPLYPAQPGRRSTTQRTDEFLARVRVTPQAATRENAFDIAHRVRDDSRGQFPWVEPDLLQQPRQAFDDVGPVSYTHLT